MNAKLFDKYRQSTMRWFDHIKKHWRFTLKTNIWSESEWIECKEMIKKIVAGWNWWNPKSEFKEQKAIYELVKDHHGSMVNVQR